MNGVVKPTRREWLRSGRIREKKAWQLRHEQPARGDLLVDPATRALVWMTLDEIALLFYFFAEGAPR